MHTLGLGSELQQLSIIGMGPPTFNFSESSYLSVISIDEITAASISCSLLPKVGMIRAVNLF